MSYEVRDLAGPDYEQWLPLWEGYNAFYERHGPTALPAPITHDTWQRLLDPAEPVHGLVVDAGGTVLGLAHYLYHRSTTMIAPICYLQDLYTSAQARGQGVARALIESVYARAKAAGSTRVYWQTQEGNLTARRLYDRVASRSGFIVYRHDV